MLFVLHSTALFAQHDNDNDNDNDNQHKKTYAYVKKKAVNKTYNVSGSDKLNIRNSFGSVEIHTWNKNEIKVEVEIEASSDKENVAQDILDRIQVSDNQSGKEISFKTTIKEQTKHKSGSSSMTINYNVYMPESNSLFISNEFGTTTIPDFKGEVDLSSKFGTLTTGNLSAVKSIGVEFGKAKLGNIPGGSLSIKYSKASIAKIAGNVKLNIEFSSKIILNLDNSLNSLDVKASYSSVNLKPVGELSASYTISTSFGSFKNKTQVKFSSDEDADGEDHGPKFDHEYNGKSGSGNIPVKVKSSFSNIILGEATDDDLKEKHKAKSKSKTADI
jgi:hypothetical protein